MLLASAKALDLNSLVLHISVFQDRPDRGHKICSERILNNFENSSKICSKSFKICFNKKNVKNDIGPIIIGINLVRHGGNLHTQWQLPLETTNTQIIRQPRYCKYNCNGYPEE